MNSTNDYDVLICGAGVGGLALAVALGQQGRRVLVIDKRSKETLVHRGEFLQPRTLGILQNWGVLSTLRTRGALNIRAMQASSANGAFMGQLNYELLPGSFNYGMVHYYHETKSALYKEANSLVEIRDNTQCVDLRFNSYGEVIGARLLAGQKEYEVSARLTVAADGRTSQLRRWMGISASMYEYPHQLLGLDLEHVSHLEPVMNAFLSSKGVRVLYPMPGQRARLYVQVERGELAKIKQQGMASWREQLLRDTPALQVIAEQIPDDFAGAQLQGAWNFCSPIWTRPGFALIGDAAHYVHPAAGQVMNAAIIDAWTLASELQAAATGEHLNEREVAQALTAYGGKRPTEFAYIARLCHRMSLCCATTSPALRAFLQWCMWLNRGNKRLQYVVTYNMSGLGVRRFTRRERLYQYGLLPDPNAAVIDF
ncbi:FAD-dependent monooxygenase [Ktedonosporobacter rubrisoli]|uniref:FAD-dependent monooxygenase n=1 Tax=Ktedonosporobacter rubrisoli TaxID=2509675 RepID=A0A4P6K5M6_KTERU|nr:NAD(P)/FAD-dependent oxidoreductase [Ktedonosporobacter rubrisoli]QBD83302.1 FAD-dependent monooxygenase [Ktedonosporobacter rubrisoli]